MEFIDQRNEILQDIVRGDITEIVKRSGFSRETVRQTLKLDTLLNATPTQEKIWEVAAKLHNEKQINAKKAEMRIVKIAKQKL